jgi:hypothetical protein
VFARANLGSGIEAITALAKLVEAALEEPPFGRRAGQL